MSQLEKLEKELMSLNRCSEIILQLTQELEGLCPWAWDTRIGALISKLQNNLEQLLEEKLKELDAMKKQIRLEK